MLTQKRNPKVTAVVDNEYVVYNEHDVRPVKIEYKYGLHHTWQVLMILPQEQVNNDQEA